MPQEEIDNSMIKVLRQLGKPALQVGQPTFTRLGTALGAITEAGLYKIGIAKVHEFNARNYVELERNIERIAAEFSDDDPVVTIPVELAQPVMERLAHVVDPKIADLFAKLLSAAGHESSSGLAHPSFIHVIDQLTPDEALMLSTLGNSHSLEFIQYGVRDTRLEASGATTIHCRYFSRLYETAGLVYPENCDFYMENLLSLGLFEVKDGWFVGAPNEAGKNVPNAEYERLEEVAKQKLGSVIKPLNFYSNNGILHPSNKCHNFIKVAMT